MGQDVRLPRPLFAPPGRRALNSNFLFTSNFSSDTPPRDHRRTLARSPHLLDIPAGHRTQYQGLLPPHTPLPVFVGLMPCVRNKEQVSAVLGPLPVTWPAADACLLARLHCTVISGLQTTDKNRAARFNMPHPSRASAPARGAGRRGLSQAKCHRTDPLKPPRQSPRSADSFAAAGIPHPPFPSR